MSFLYSISIYLYALVIRLAALFNPQAKAFLQGRREQFKRMQAAVGKHDEIIWFHCASLGEFEQGRPVIEAFRNTFPHYKILLTFFSPSGYELRKNEPLADYVFYLPMDKKRNVQRFLNIFKPRLAIFIKYEFWYNYIDALYKNKIPVFLVSGIFRKNQHFFRFYGRWFRHQLQKISWFFVQNETSSELLSRIHVYHHEISGDTRFDRVLQIKKAAQPLALIEQFKNNEKLLVAGSTWPPDEDILHFFHTAEGSNIKLIIAPHKVDEPHIKNIIKKFEKSKPVRYSMAQSADLEISRVLIIDQIGLLSSIYQYADLAYVGGGFGVGIHNLLEAAVYGIPVLFGPNYQRFKEAHDLLNKGAGFNINSAESFVNTCSHLLNTPHLYQNSGKAASDYVLENAGATDYILQKTKEFIVAKKTIF
jgi:3-deoxy-D-manno-octulosonic-acid transferase